MRILGVGPCPICATKIWKFKMPALISWNENGGQINWRPRPYELNESGTHFFVLQTDSSRMMIAICKGCLSTLDDEKVKKIFADITFTKLSKVKGNTDQDYKLFDRIRTIEVWKWFINEKLLSEYMEGSLAKEHSPS